MLGVLCVWGGGWVLCLWVLWVGGGGRASCTRANQPPPACPPPSRLPPPPPLFTTAAARGGLAAAGGPPAGGHPRRLAPGARVPVPPPQPPPTPLPPIFFIFFCAPVHACTSLAARHKCATHARAARERPFHPAPPPGHSAFACRRAPSSSRPHPITRYAASASSPAALGHSTSRRGRGSPRHRSSCRTTCARRVGACGRAGRGGV